MAGRTVFTKIHVELIILCLHTQFFHTRCQLLIVVFSLASSDDLTDTRYQTVYCCHSLIVIIHLHIECFDILRIICYKYRTLKSLLCQITLMLCLKIHAPGYLVIEFVIVLLQHLNSFCISHSCEVRRYHILQTVDQTLIYE